MKTSMYTARMKVANRIRAVSAGVKLVRNTLCCSTTHVGQVPQSLYACTVAIQLFRLDQAESAT